MESKDTKSSARVQRQPKCATATVRFPIWLLPLPHALETRALEGREQKTRNHQREPKQARVCRLSFDLTPPPRSRGRRGARGHVPSDGAGGSPPTARVRNHGIGVATDDFSHTHGVERHKTISASPKPAQVRRGYRSISELAPPARTRALEGREVPEGTWRQMHGGLMSRGAFLKLRETRISRSKELRRAIRLWFVCIF